MTIFRAIRRARTAILSVALAYALSILAGIAMVHSGNGFALRYGAALVQQAAQDDPAARAAIEGQRLHAALWDFLGNLVLGAVPKTITGFAIVLPYPWIALQGWVGGIVSVRGDRTSRLTTARSASYYLLTLVLQVIPYSLAIGGGINAGVSMFRPAPWYTGEKSLKICPTEAIRDLGRLYVAAGPLFLMASLWEFFSPWNV